MNISKTLGSLLLAFIFLCVQISSVGAAPANQDTTPITGSVDSVTIEADAETGVTTVLVALTGENGVTQTITLSVETAVSLGFVTDDGTGTPVVNEDVLGTSVEIDPTLVIAEEEEKQHPVGSALSDFFSDLLGVDYETIMDYHNDGMGFGVMAQALWMTNALEGDTTTFSAILEAKKSGDYSGITLPDGSTPQNWGQFRKAVMKDRDKAKENLGAIMSGHAKKGDEAVKLDKLDKGNASHKEKNNNKDKGKKKNKGKGND